MPAWKSVAIATVLSALAARGALAAEGGHTSPTIARETAESNAKTPTGRRYGNALDASLDKWLRKTIERCVKGVSRDELISFEAFVRISESGEAEEVVFAPETAVSRCAEKDFQNADYPHPPQPSWWVRIEVGLK
jgi:hypothetical protein